jgi:hypothetical protein
MQLYTERLWRNSNTWKLWSHATWALDLLDEQKWVSERVCVCARTRVHAYAHEWKSEIVYVQACMRTWLREGERGHVIQWCVSEWVSVYAHVCVQRRFVITF